MTDREKLIELIRDGVACPDDGNPFEEERCASCRYRDDVDCDFLRLADHLLANGVRLFSFQATSEKTSDKTSEWVSVKDRLPETHLRCLVYREGYNKMGGYLTMATFTPCYKGLEGDLMDGRQVWYDYDSEVGDYELTNVTHWMPMPVPPKEGTE